MGSKMVEVTERMHEIGPDGIKRLAAIPGDLVTEHRFAELAAGKPSTPIKALTEHKVPELKEIAEDEGVDLSSAKTKPEIIKAIEAARAAAKPADEPTDDLDKMDLEELVELSALLGGIDPDGLEREELIEAIRAKRADDTKE